MTISEEAAALQPEISKLRTDKRRRYPDELKQRILAWADRAIASGIDVQNCGRMIGLKRGDRIKKWQRAATEGKGPRSTVVAAKRDDKAVPLVPVAVETSDVGQLVLVMSTGHRVEGLSFAQVRELLTVLA